MCHDFLLDKTLKVDKTVGSHWLKFRPRSFQFILVVLSTMLAEKSRVSQFDLPVTSGSEGRLTIELSGSTLRLDRALPSDEPLLYLTYASTRSEELAITNWSAEQEESFLRMQYEAQRSSYRLQFPDAEYWVIRRNDTAVGRLTIDRAPHEIHVVDIALLQEFRKRGIGSALMQEVQREAARAAKPVRLHVERFNPALHWYERLGFAVTSAGPIYLEMVWRPSQASQPESRQPALGAANPCI